MFTYKKFIPHAKKLTNNKSTEGKPVLKGIKHFEDGRVVVTDSHRLYMLEGLSEVNKDVVLNVVGLELEGEYPNIERLIPTYDAEQPFDVEIKELLTVTDLVASLGKTVGMKPPIIDFKEDEAYLIHEDVKMKWSLSFDFKASFAMNANYLNEALKLLKAMKVETATFHFYGRLRPALIEAPGVKIIILPVRRL